MKQCHISRKWYSPRVFLPFASLSRSNSRFTESGIRLSFYSATCLSLSVFLPPSFHSISTSYLMHAAWWPYPPPPVGRKELQRTQPLGTEQSRSCEVCSDRKQFVISWVISWEILTKTEGRKGVLLLLPVYFLSIQVKRLLTAAPAMESKQEMTLTQLSTLI